MLCYGLFHCLQGEHRLQASKLFTIHFVEAYYRISFVKRVSFLDLRSVCLYSQACDWSSFSCLLFDKQTLLIQFVQDCRKRQLEGIPRELTNAHLYCPIFWKLSQLKSIFQCYNTFSATLLFFQSPYIKTGLATCYICY